MLYSRLAKFKSIAEQLASESKNGSNPLAVHLGLLPEELINFGERINNADHFYELFLQSVEKLFDGKVEQPIFEDQMRYMFGVKVGLSVDKISSHNLMYLRRPSRLSLWTS